MSTAETGGQDVRLQPGERWLIVAPTRPEFQAVLKAIRDRHDEARVVLRRSGIGPARAAACAAALTADPAANTGIAGIALLGWAGGLTEELIAGGSVVADVALYANRPALPCRPILLPGAARGPVLTVPAALASPAAKAEAAAYGALAVEMEAYPLAAWAHAHGLPFVHARVILDGLNEPLPDLAGVIDGAGRVRPLRLLRASAARPALVPELWRFARRVRLVNVRLTALTTALLAALGA